MAPHSSTLALKIPLMEEPGGLQSMGLLRVRHDWLHFHVSLSCIGEGNGNPLQCSCLGNPRDGGAWWAAIYGVAQSRTRLKWLSISSSSRKPGLLQSMRLQRLGHNLVTKQQHRTVSARSKQSIYVSCFIVVVFITLLFLGIYKTNIGHLLKEFVPLCTVNLIKLKINLFLRRWWPWKIFLLWF